ncbi:MAG: response regulator, partial [Gammaproteobacteria bacterium]|nr:response regulator [Gammaproteobacteria bacterium]
MSVLTKEQLDYVGKINRSAMGMMDITINIKDFSRIEAGMPLCLSEGEPFDLRACVEKSLDIAASNLAPKKLNLTYMIAENTPDILIGDIARWQQILVNLLGSAVRFTDCGEAAISVTAHNTKTDDRSSPPDPAAYYEMHFAVRSTGAGIYADRIQRLFQLYPSLHHEFGSADLPELTVSKRLSELMGGRIWVESEKNKDLVFHFTIKEILGKKQIDKTKVRILLVDALQFNRKIMLLLLKKLGYCADVVCDGLRALEALDRQSYDVVFMGVQMPNMDGLAVTRRIIEKWPAAQRPWIIAMSANAMNTKARDRELCLQAGMNDHISRPIHSQDLAEALAAYMEHH